jgi:hypothetical protein
MDSSLFDFSSILIKVLSFIIYVRSLGGAIVWLIDECFGGSSEKIKNSVFWGG